MLCTDQRDQVFGFSQVVLPGRGNRTIEQSLNRELRAERH